VRLSFARRGKGKSLEDYLGAMGSVSKPSRSRNGFELLWEVYDFSPESI
jgi:hypothetical protein